MNTVKERRAKVKRVLEGMTAEEVVEFAEELRLTRPDTEITESTVSRLKAMLHFFGSLPKTQKFARHATRLDSPVP